MSRRPTTDAKIVLERAGYIVNVWKHSQAFMCFNPDNNLTLAARLKITGDTVDNDEVVKLLNARGLDEFGQRRDCINADDMAEAELNSYGYDPTGPEAGAGFRDYPPDTFDDPTWDWD